VETLDIALPTTTSKTEGTRESTTIVSTISSDGKIFVYDLAALPAETTEKLQLHPVAEYDTKGTRLTCLTVAEGRSTIVNGKRKGREEESEKEDEVEWEPNVDET
jgi:protein MAK11